MRRRGSGGDALLILEPDHHGHRYSYARYVLDAVDRPVVLATIRGAQELTEFQDQLGASDLTVVECFDEQFPPVDVMVREAARIVADPPGGVPIGQVAILDADRPLKSWWWHAPRGLRGRLRVSFLLTRYPLHLSGGSPRVVVRRLAMVAAILAARATGNLGRVVALGPRGTAPRHGLVTRVSDPAINGAHSRDRAALRERQGLDPDAFILGVFGVITPDKNAPLLLQSLRPGELLLLGGKQDAEVTAWLDGLSPADRERVVSRGGYLSERDLDELMAAVDVVSVVMNYDRPSAIMGKALAAGVPVISGGSRVRAEELAATGAGIDVAIEVGAVRAGLDDLAGRPVDALDRAAAEASPTTLALAVIGD